MTPIAYFTPLKVARWIMKVGAVTRPEGAGAGFPCSSDRRNTNKRSRVLDLEAARDRETLLQLVDRADALVESFAPGYLVGLGFGWDEIHRRRPDLPMVSITNFGQRRDIPAIMEEGGHGGADPILLDSVFANAQRPDHLKLPDSRAGALSCLTGIAARKSCEEKRPVRVSELVRL